MRWGALCAALGRLVAESAAVQGVYLSWMRNETSFRRQHAPADNIHESIEVEKLT